MFSTINHHNTKSQAPEVPACVYIGVLWCNWVCWSVACVLLRTLMFFGALFYLGALHPSAVCAWVHSCITHFHLGLLGGWAEYYFLPSEKETSAWLYLDPILPKTGFPGICRCSAQYEYEWQKVDPPKYWSIRNSDSMANTLLRFLSEVQKPLDTVLGGWKFTLRFTQS